MKFRWTIILAGLAATIPGAQPQEGGQDNVRTPRFVSPPTVRAYAKDNTSRVVTVTTASLDNGGGPDLATVQADGTLNVMFNNGRGEFPNTYHNSTATQWKPNVVYIEAADLNGDNYDDLVAMDSANSALFIFMNKGDGTFADAANVPVAPTSGAKLQGGALAIADVNGDGKPDVITIARVSTAASTTLSQQTFFGNGDGTFQPGSETDSSFTDSVAIFPGKSLSLTDVNQDGTTDLVLQLDNRGIVIAVAFGAGDGTFQSIPAGTPAVASGPQPAASLVLGDVDGDKLPDAVFVTFSDRIYVARGLGDGSFGPATPVAFSLAGVVLVQLADTNKDSALDIIAFAAGEIGVFTGKGDGTFRLTSQYTSGYGLFRQPSAADFNGDGNLDIAALDYTNGQIVLYAGNGGGTFQGTVPMYRTGQDEPKWAANAQVILSADLNGDSTQDFLTYEWVQSTVHGQADLYSALNDGTGKFTYRLALPSGTLQELGGRYNGFAIDSTTADFNGDHRADLIYRTGSGISVALSQEDGTISPEPLDVAFPVPVSCMPFNYLTTGDVNGDGAQDIVAGFVPNRNCPPSASTPAGFFVLLGDGRGHFEARFTPFGDAIYFAHLGDWNGDGKPDLVVADNIAGRGMEVLVMPGQGNGDFDTGAARTVLPVGQFVSDLTSVDYNGDGRLDLVIPTAGTATSDGAPDITTAGVLLLAGQGDLTSAEPTGVLKGIAATHKGVGFADFNGDGRPDLVLSTYSKAQALSEPFGVIVLPNEGEGKFGEPQSLLAPLNVSGRNPVVFTADYNIDGAPDILTASGLAGQLFLNTTRGQ